MHLFSCPVCRSQQIQPWQSATDHTVSGTAFTIWHCNGCTARFTQDAPDEQASGSYYKSAAYISHSNSGEGLVNSIYRQARKITLQIKRRQVLRFSQLKSGKLLDIGCGTGAFAHTMQSASWQVVGIEPDEVARLNAEQLYGFSPLLPTSLYTLPAGQWQVITLWHVLEHVYDLHGYFQEFKRLLQPSGVCFIAVPNYTSADAHHYQANWAAYDVPRHLYHFSPQSFAQLAADHGFTIKAKLPMWLDAWYVALLSEQYLNNKWGIPAALWQGLKSTLAALGNNNKCSSLIYVLQQK